MKTKAKLEQSGPGHYIEQIVRDEILGMFSKKTKVHWSELVERFVEPKTGESVCNRATLIRVMNDLLVPHGKLRGVDHWYWFE